VFRYGGKKKRLLPQYLVCDKSLKRTHDIGHFCRDDAAMQQFPERKNENCPLLPFIKSIKTEWGKAVKRDTEIFSESYPVWERGWSKQGRKDDRVCVHRLLKTNRLKHDFVFTSRLEASGRRGR